MTATCYQLPPSVAEELLQLTARSMCDRPGESAEQRDSRTRQMVHLALAMQPRDGLEYMLSIMAVGHFYLILDSMRDVLAGQLEAQNSRAKSTIVALDRVFLGFVKELRLSRKRPSADQPAEARSEATRGETMAGETTGGEATPGEAARGETARGEEMLTREARNPATSEAGTHAPKPPMTAAKASPIPAAARTSPTPANGIEHLPPKPNAGPMTAQPSAGFDATEKPRPLQTSVNATDPKPGLLQPLKHTAVHATPKHVAEFEEMLAALAGTPEAVRARNAAPAD